MLQNKYKLGILLGVLLLAALALSVFKLWQDPADVNKTAQEADSIKSKHSSADTAPSLFKTIPTVSPEYVPEKSKKPLSEELEAQTQVSGVETNPETSRQVDHKALLEEAVHASVQQHHAGEQIKNDVMQGTQQQQKGTQFTKIAFSGEALDNSSLRWDCARDTNTRLLWETKLSNAGVSDAEHTYSWYEPDQQASSERSSGYADNGRCYGIACDTFSYAQEINRIGLCGSHAWRIPTFKELQTLLDRDYFNPTINQKIFQYTQGAAYWTSTRLEFDPNMIMQIDFFNGTSSPAPIRFDLSLRLVSP